MRRKGSMTIEEIKKELPDVFISISGKVFRAKVEGSLNKYASVSPYVCSPSVSVEYSWEAIHRAVNNGTTLRM